MGRLEGVATLVDQRGQLSLPPPTQLEGEGWGLEPASRGCSGLGMIVPCVSGSLDLLCRERF